MLVHRGAPRALLLTALGLGAGCGDEASGAAAVTLVPSFQLGGRVVDCAEAPGLEALEVALFDATGTSLRAGYPTRVPCGDVLVSGPAGPAVLEVRALGEVDGNPDAVLFQARLDVELPAARRPVMLDPQVAFLTLDWNFGERGLEPCATEVAAVRAIVSAAGSQRPAFSRELRCDARPLLVEQPLALAPHTVSVRAISEEGFPVYAHTAQRVFDRGENAYTAVLAPSGGQVLVDWAFELEGRTLDACDDERVAVTEVVATVRGLIPMNGQLVPDGSPPVTDRFDCAAPRPVAFRPARFVDGRELELELVAEGAHRFRAVRRFTMPSGDAVLDRVPLPAVGTATGAAEARSRGCEGLAVTLEVAPESGAGPTRRVDLEAPRGTFRFENLAYGVYTVSSRPTSGAASCPPRTARRTVDARTSAWGLIPL